MVNTIYVGRSRDLIGRDSLAAIKGYVFGVVTGVIVAWMIVSFVWVK